MVGEEVVRWKMQKQAAQNTIGLSNFKSYLDAMTICLINKLMEIFTADRPPTGILLPKPAGIAVQTISVYRQLDEMARQS